MTDIGNATVINTPDGNTYYVTPYHGETLRFWDEKKKVDIVFYRDEIDWLIAALKHANKDETNE